MDILFWKNILYDLNVSTEDIKKNLKLEMFNKVFGGCSMFHYFADNEDVIEIYHDKYYMTKGAD